MKSVDERIAAIVEEAKASVTARQREIIKRLQDETRPVKRTSR